MRIQRGSNFDNVFFFFFFFFFFLFFVFLADEGRKDPNTTIIRPSTAASDTPFQWRFAGGLM